MSRTSFAAQNHEGMDGGPNKDVFLAIEGDGSTFIADIDLAEELFATFNAEDAWRDVTLVIIDVDGIPFLFTKDCSFLEWLPSIIETTNLIREFNQDLNGTNISLVFIVEPSKVCSDLNDKYISSRIQFTE